MNKLPNSLLAAISLIIAVATNLKIYSILNIFMTSLLIFYILLALIIFGIIKLIIKLIKAAKEKNIKRVISLGALSLLMIIVYFLLKLFVINSSICASALQRAHFRTNIITGKCDFGGEYHCLAGDPWYYKPDCDISNEEKEIIKSKFQSNYSQDMYK